ncbi:MAG: hypothetical protein LBI67_07765 [Treponema sp.]|jgi:hypothetical protein|nr:hypothetical protein [Treponema sp.]
MEDFLPILEQNEVSSDMRILDLRKKIDDEDYLYGAIQRIALVLSNEITSVSRRKANERK